jgi:hypothetical protein
MFALSACHFILSSIGFKFVIFQVTISSLTIKIGIDFNIYTPELVEKFFTGKKYYHQKGGFTS